VRQIKESTTWNCETVRSHYIWLRSKKMKISWPFLLDFLSFKYSKNPLWKLQNGCADKNESSDTLIKISMLKTFREKDIRSNIFGSPFQNIVSFQANISCRNLLEYTPLLKPKHILLCLRHDNRKQIVQISVSRIVTIWISLWYRSPRRRIEKKRKERWEELSRSTRNARIQVIKFFHDNL